MADKRFINANDISFNIPFEYSSGDIFVDIEDVKRAIAKTPTADVVEVVRCKDCEKSKPTKTEELCYCFLLHDCRKYDDFCSYGIRKGATDERN